MATASEVLNGHGEMKRYIRTAGNSEIKLERLCRHMDLWFTQKRVNSQSSCVNSVVCKVREAEDGTMQKMVVLKPQRKASAKEGKVLTLDKEHVLQLERGEDLETLEIGGEELWRVCCDPAVVFKCDAAELDRYSEIAALLCRQRNMLYVDDSYCDPTQLLARIACVRLGGQ